MKDREAQKIKRMYSHYNWKCFVCNEGVKERAHILGDTIPNTNRYGKEVIGNILNWLPACGTDHNSLIDISNNIMAREVIVTLIRDAENNQELTREVIEDIVRENIKRKRGKNEK
jgi:hypothetical protein